MFRDTQPAKLSRLRVENIVATVDLFTRLDLDEVMRALDEPPATLKYDPEEFPGLIYHPYKAGITLLIFNSGKCVVTGVQEF